MMIKEKLKKLIDTAAGRVAADVVIRNTKVVDVFSGTIIEGDIAICDEWIAGIGRYEGKEIVDGKGRYIAPGFIDGHIHIESSYLCPEEIGRLLVPRGSTTIIADPHEIVNVCGIRGLDYMLEAAKGTVLDIKYMLPSCVPSTSFEHAGAVLDAAAMEEPIKNDDILGLGEFMNFIGVAKAEDAILDKLLVAKKEGKIIDGHVPGLAGNDLNAYAAAGIHDDHECSSIEEMNDRLKRGFYILMREGSACHDLRVLLKGVTSENSRRCVLCSDDRQPKTMLEEGHIDNHLRICVEEGIDPITAIRMATLNAAECFRLYDRGAVAPGYRADLALLDDLKEFRARKVWIAGQLAAEDGVYLPKLRYCDISSVKGSIKLKDFSADCFKMHLTGNKVNVIRIMPGGIVTKKVTAQIQTDSHGEFVRDPKVDIIKVAVVERHNKTGLVANGFLQGYGLKTGAVAVSVAHDSHNIIVAGISDEDMAKAVEALAALEGGIVLIKDGEIVSSMPMPIAGLMTDKSGEWVNERLIEIHEKAHNELGISQDVEPITTLSFMALPVVPEIKLTDRGLFDVTSFSFIDLESQ